MSLRHTTVRRSIVSSTVTAIVMLGKRLPG